MPLMGIAPCAQVESYAPSKPMHTVLFIFAGISGSETSAGLHHYRLLEASAIGPPPLTAHSQAATLSILDELS